eukprot:1183246-Prorocentrum_minimum.AAC.1
MASFNAYSLRGQSLLHAAKPGFLPQPKPPNKSFGGRSPEKKAGDVLRNMFTFLAARCVIRPTYLVCVSPLRARCKTGRSLTVSNHVQGRSSAVGRLRQRRPGLIWRRRLYATQGMQT